MGNIRSSDPILWNTGNSRLDELEKVNRSMMGKKVELGGGS